MLTLRNPLLETLTAPFENAWNDSPAMGWKWQCFSPAADIHETQEKYVIELDVPGMSEKDIQVTLENRHLSLKGERKPAENVEYSRRERAFGAFERLFVLPQDADTARVEAKVRNGVLSVEIPKHEQAKPKTIEVKSE